MLNYTDITILSSVGLSDAHGKVSAADGSLTELFESRSVDLVATNFLFHVKASSPSTPCHYACAILQLLDRLLKELLFLLLFLDGYLKISHCAWKRMHIQINFFFYHLFFKRMYVKFFQHIISFYDEIFWI